MDVTATGTALGQIVIAIGVAASIVMQWLKTRRLERAAAEQAESAKLLATAKADELAGNLAEDNESLRKTLRLLTEKLDQNTAISQEALHEANNVNQKIANVNAVIASSDARWDALLQQVQGQRGTLEIAYDTGEDTNVRARRIEIATDATDTRMTAMEDRERGRQPE